VQLGIGSASDKTLYYEGGTATGTGFNTDKFSGWSAQLGAEYHLSGTDKMSPYFMGALNFGGGSTSYTGENNDGTDFLAGVSYEGKTSNSSIGLGIGAGMDYYIAENIYLGLELGWGWNKLTDKGGSTSSTTGGITTEADIKGAGSSSGMGTGAMNTAFRIGWRF
jgi:opacity protein-like surface antigen